MIFEKPSLRTRVSFAVRHEPLRRPRMMLRQEEIGLDTREPVKDVARVLAGMCDGIMARTFEHEKVTDLAKWSSVPVINGLTDYSHPCQAMADLMTVEEHFGTLAGLTLAFIGDGNNVARSLATGLRASSACSSSWPRRRPMSFRARMSIASCRRCPSWISSPRKTRPTPCARPTCIYTDTWVSMGQEAEKAKRIKDFAGYQVDENAAGGRPEARDRAALPAGLSRPGDQRRASSKARSPRLPAGGKPAAFPEGLAGGADGEGMNNFFLSPWRSSG